MRVVIFCHSIRSDWNHGNAHFLRGVATELQRRGHEVRVFEPEDGWSARHLVETAGPEALDGYRSAYPSLASTTYTPDRLDLDAALDGAELVLVHEWNDPAIVAAIGRVRARGGRFVLLFHDTHHRTVTDPDGLAAFDLDAYDGVLAFGEVVRERYLRAGWTRRAWTWHEAADADRFRPLPPPPERADLVWVGNWGDDERTRELHEYLLEPVRTLGLRATIHGVRYPDHGLAAIARAGARYGGWLPNYRVPEAFAAHRVTVHVPRRPYVEALPGIPTIRVFEALACGIPLVSAPWDDVERLFEEGRDYVMARSGEEMTARLRELVTDADRAAALARAGRATIERRHTCAHRVTELLDIVSALRGARERSWVA